mgnify:CR=1 FL=1
MSKHAQRSSHQFGKGFTLVEVLVALLVLSIGMLGIAALYLDSLRALGIVPEEHDIRFVEDDWESPTLGASGLGWEVWLDGMEITQFTYFQMAGSIELSPVSVEITYGLERIAMYLQQIDNVYDLKWNQELRYGDVAHRQEVEQSADVNVDAVVEQVGEFVARGGVALGICNGCQVLVCAW